MEGNRCCTQRVASNLRWCDCINLIFWKKVLKSLQCTSANLQKNKSINSFSYETVGMQKNCSKVWSLLSYSSSQTWIFLKVLQRKIYILCILKWNHLKSLFINSAMTFQMLSSKYDFMNWQCNDDEWDVMTGTWRQNGRPSVGIITTCLWED